MKMGVYEELIERGLIAQVTNEEEIREMINNGKATFYIVLYYFLCHHLTHIGSSCRVAYHSRTPAY